VTISFRIVLGLVLVAGPTATFLQSTAAAAMDFSTKRLPDGDYFVLAKGEIIAGDLERLRVALRTVGRDRYGNLAMALDSGGGLVSQNCPSDG
jgi:hypothetical protein